MMATRRKSTAPSISAVSRETGVARQTLRLWRDTEGLDIGDLAAVRKRAAMKRPATTSAPPSLDTGESYSQARRRREIALANRAELIAAREAGSVIDHAEVTRAFQQAGLELRARLMALRGELVLQLHGLDEGGIYRVLDENFRDMLTAIATEAPIPQSKDTP